MASSSTQTYYEILGITQQAQTKEVRDAYHKLALKCHPDKDPCNPRAVAAFQELSAAYDILSDTKCRTKYDLTLSSSQRTKQSPQPSSWPPQTSFGPNDATRMWQEKMRRRAWEWSSRKQEMADQARREDSDYWSGPTYAHGATDRGGWEKCWDREQQDTTDPHEHRQRQRAARKEARREARREAKSGGRDVSPPPPQHPFDQWREQSQAQAEGYKEQDEAQERAADWSDKLEKESYESVKRAKKERSDRRRAERETEKKWPAELFSLLSKIIDIQVDIEKMGDKVDDSKSATKDERKDENYEQVFELSIKRRSLKRRLKECLDDYKRIVTLLRDRGREQEANEADVKLRNARKKAAKVTIVDHKRNSQREEAGPMTEAQTKGKAKTDRGNPSPNNESWLPHDNLNTPQATGPSDGIYSNVERPLKTMLPIYDGQYDEGTTRQQRPCRYGDKTRANYDDSDPDRGFTEDTPEPSVAGANSDYDDSDYDPPFYNDFHDSHMDVHREFWDIMDSQHECYFCHNISLTMEVYDLLVINGLVVTASDVGHYDIAIKDEKIGLLAPKGSLVGIAAKRVIDAEGGYVMPGGVDAHIHLDEPPLFGKGKSADDYETGTRSAVCGGTTTIIAFAPQSKSDPALLPVLQQTHLKANHNCYTDYSFHLLISDPTPAVLSEFSALREEGISSLKIYMTYEALQLRDNQILDVLLEARRNGITTLIHAENGDVLSWMTKQLETRGLYAPKYHATSRPQIVETEATNRAIALSSIIDTPILIVHVSSPSAAAHIRHAQTKGLRIYAETCPQYLFLTRSDLMKPGFEGAKCVCSPPPREGSEDHEAIWRGLSNGTFAILSSDHCPFVYDDREGGKKSVLSEEYPEGRFRYIPNGCPGVETRLPLVLCEGVKRLGLSKFVEVTSSNAAKLYGLYPKKGALLPGLSDADLCIWYPPGQLEPFRVQNGQLHHHVDYTPYEGREVDNWPRWTILRGKVMWARDEGGLVGGKGFGEFVKRAASQLAEGGDKGDWDVESF